VIFLFLAASASKVSRSRVPVDSIPLSGYRSFYTMRTDAFDRFATRLEKRFTNEQIRAMLAAAGLEQIHFNEQDSYWCAIGYRTKIGMQ